MGQNDQEQVTESLRALVYVRISDDPDGSERQVDRQEADCRAYAADHGWEVVAVFRENDTSAFKQRTITLPSGERVRRVIRPEFRAMLKHFADRQAQVMIAYDLDRAVRDPRDLEVLIDAKVPGGFSVRSVTGSLRLDTDSDVAMARVLVAPGMGAGCRSATGPLVAEAAQRVLAGESLYWIRKDWNQRGVLTTHGCAWSDGTLKLMLRNPSFGWI